MTAIDAMPAPVLACGRLIDCPVCDYPRYVPESWPVDVCPECVFNPAHREQLEFIYNDALAKANALEMAWNDAYAAAPADAQTAMNRLMLLRSAITDDDTKQTFLAFWKQVQTVDGLPLLAEIWKRRVATVNACTSTLDAVQPKLDALLTALHTLEQNDE